VSFRILLAIAGLGLSLNIAAQIPTTVQPGRVAQTFSQSTSQPSAPAPNTISTAPEQENLNGAAANVQFKLTQITLAGNTVYSTQQLSTLYKNKLNTTITVSQLLRIVQDITNYYRNNGYILSRAVLPPQRIANGVVHIRIIEGFIDKVSVSGAPKGARTLLQSYGEKIAATRPLKTNVLERYMRLANEIPGVTAKAILEPSKTTTGASDLTLSAETKTASGFISYDNYSTRYIGPTELTASGELNSIFRSGDKTTLTVAGTDKTTGLRYAELAHDTPLGSNGTRLTIGGNYAETQPGSTLESLYITGRAKNLYTSIKYPLYLTRAQSLYLTTGFNYLDSVVTSSGSQLYVDHIRKIYVDSNYNFADGWNGNNLLGLTLTRGLNILGATPENDPNVSRTGGHSVFTKLNFQATRIQALYGRFSAFALVQGQYAFVPLLASEQFGFGGPQVGRGYDASEIIGDRGLNGSAELRMDVAPNKKLLQVMQFYAFYDVGKIWNLSTSSGQPGYASAAATGLGTRLFFTRNISGNLYWAKPLTRPVAAEDNGKAPRVYFGVTVAG
jgi:hemolysin activation/secretion protein